MDPNAFQLIPTDVIKAWAKGDYYVGDIPSISYRHLGIALLLRGWYTYVDITKDGTHEDWAGVAKVDIKGSVLSMGGVRLFGPNAVFWRTEHSYIQDAQEIVWFYSGFKCDTAPLTDISDKYFKNSTLKLDAPGNRFGMDPERWKDLLRTLATEFDDDIGRIAKISSVAEKEPQKNGHGKDMEKDLGMLRFRVDLDQCSTERVRKCEYYHYDSATKQATAGLSAFRKVAIEGVL